MNRNKSLFIIPGYKHHSTSKPYKAIAKVLRNEGFLPILINIPWKQTTISQNTEYFLKKYAKVNTKKKYVLGFSYGAMIAFLASTKIKVSGLILCSLSPYFKEDLAKVKENLVSTLRMRRYQDFSKLHCQTLAKQIRAKQVHLLYGTKEAKSLIKRVRKAYKQISSSDKCLVPIKAVEHNIADKKYLQKIHQIVRELN